MIHKKSSKNPEKFQQKHPQNSNKIQNIEGKKQLLFIGTFFFSNVKSVFCNDLEVDPLGRWSSRPSPLDKSPLFLSIFETLNHMLSTYSFFKLNNMFSTYVFVL